MDFSEYEALKNNIDLLEKANNDLKDAHNKIEELQTEKINVLKENENNVTIIKKSNRHIYIKDSVNIDNLLEHIIQLFSQDYRTTLRYNSTLYYAKEYLVNIIRDSIINNTQNIEEEVVLSSSLKSFKEELKENLEKDYLDNLDKDSKSKINGYIDMSNKYNNQLQNIVALEKDLNSALDQIKSYEESITELNSKLEKENKVASDINNPTEIINKYSERINDLNRIIGKKNNDILYILKKADSFINILDEIGLFNRSFKVNEIKEKFHTLMMKYNYKKEE